MKPKEHIKPPYLQFSAPFLLFFPGFCIRFLPAHGAPRSKVKELNLQESRRLSVSYAPVSAMQIFIAFANTRK